MTVLDFWSFVAIGQLRRLRRITIFSFERPAKK